MVNRTECGVRDFAAIVLLLVFSGEAVWLHYTGRVTSNQALQRQASPDNILHISIEDVAVTGEIVKAGKILDIDVLDHLVIGCHRVRRYIAAVAGKIRECPRDLQREPCIQYGE
jgi:hypothetical protein